MVDVSPPPGWYPDPDDPSSWRWWSGESWTAHRASFGSQGVEFDLPGRRFDEQRLATIASVAPALYAIAAIGAGIVDWIYSRQLENFFHSLRLAFMASSQNGAAFGSQVTPYPVWLLGFSIPSFGAQVVLLVWQYRSARVAQALGYRMRYSPGWGVASWLVPVVQLWMPYIAIRDLLPSGDRLRRLLPFWWSALITEALVTAGLPLAFVYHRAAGIALFLLTVLVSCSLAILGRTIVLGITASHRERDPQ